MTMAETEQLAQKLQALGLNDTTVGVLPGSNPVQNPVDLFRSYISGELSKISGIDQEVIFAALEFSNQPERGDLVLPVPRLRIKDKKGGELVALANEWVSKFPQDSLIEKAVAKGPFIQFFFSGSVLYKLVVRDILTRKADYGASTVGKGQKVVIEFSSPNIAKPFHAGHLRSTIIGGFLSHLHEKLGYDVVSLNYLGDWGKQFGILAVGYKRYGDAAKLEEDPINHLFEVYVMVNKEITEEKEKSKAETGTEESATDDEARSYFKKMEDGDEEALGLWKKFRELSIEKYRETYGRLNIRYDQYRGESLVPKETMELAQKQFAEKNLITDDNGAKLIDLTPYSKKLGKTIVQKRDGTSLYLTRDVGEAIARHNEYKFDKMIYVIASQQDLHTAQFFKILELMGYEWSERLQHINFGLVLGMSTRKGTVVFLDTILEETKQAMHEVMKRNEEKYKQIPDPDKVADLVGIAAVVIQDMQSKRINNYNFNWNRMLSFEGDTGPYLQYAHARLRSMERKAAEQGIVLESQADIDSIDVSKLTEPIAKEMIRCLVSYPDVLLMALRNMEPSTVVTYLFKLTHLVSSCYDVLWVAGQEKDVATARLALYSAARQVLHNGLTIVGLTPVDRM
ncbi:arginine--tRNA ligase, cytoplasmic [Trichomonascus vanleenenianus]|uniref:arginine--tRNA ligase n=1 Tax=Trichomonascus vanleenenianus TaxID=2268995 RepID=UPI003ECA16BA